jgi:aerobic-type carbon monoxide dehydrogenase small subunit (CoxS/CutS family)
MNIPITLVVNGDRRDVSVEPTEMLLDVLRDRLGYVGANKVCAQGICGACTVIVDGQAATSCLLLAAQADGAQIRTVEGLENDRALDPLQEAFINYGAVQCGFCTPGFLMTARALLDENPTPTREEIVDALRGNICRCTGYAKIVEAVAAAAKASAASAS